MSKLFRNRWLRWTLVVGVQIALGWCIYQVQEPEPMCEIDAKTRLRHFAGSGRMLATSHLSHFGADDRHPVQIWNTHTGDEIAHQLEQPGENLRVFRQFSWNGRFVVTETAAGEFDRLKDHSLQLVDLEEGKAQRIALDDIRIGYSTFSPNADILVRVQSDSGGLKIYDTANGRLVELLSNAALHERFNEQTLFYLTPSGAKAHRISFWSIADRKTIATIETAYPIPIVASSADGSRSVVDRGVVDESKNNFVVWNARTRQIDGAFGSVMNHHLEPRISPNGNYMALTGWDEEGRFVKLRELPSGRTMGTFRPDIIQAVEFSPDSRLLALTTHGPETRQMIVMLAVPTLKLLWTHASNTHRLCFTSDSRTLFANSDERTELLGRDCETGEVQNRVRLSDTSIDSAPILQPTPDAARLLIIHQPVERYKRVALLERMPWLRQWFLRTNDVVVVLDVDRRSELLRLEGMNVNGPLLSNDGRVLATLHPYRDRTIIRCWDVDAWKPLRWAISVPMCIGAIIASFAWWRGRRKPRTEAQPRTGDSQ